MSYIQQPHKVMYCSSSEKSPEKLSNRHHQNTFNGAVMLHFFYRVITLEMIPSNTSTLKVLKTLSFSTVRFAM